MVQIFAATALAVVAAAIAIIRGHHLFGIALALIAAYELAGPLLLVVADDTVSQGVQLFADHSGGQAIEPLLWGLFLFFGLFIASYLAANLRKDERHWPKADTSATSVLAFVPIILAFGLVSMVTGTGQARLEDYVGESRATTRFFSYGALLYVVCTAIALHQWIRRQWWGLVGTVVCVVPLSLELFTAGRRQWFAPSALLVLILILYSPRRYKAALAGGLVILTACLFAIQYGLREQIQQGASGHFTEPLALAVLGPQLNEFVGVGLITLNTWTLYVSDASAPLTWGVHWLFHALNSVPFLKLGDELFPHYAEALYASYNRVAPWGALSMLADAILAFGWIGVPIAAVVLGSLCHFAHRCAVAYLGQGRVPGSAQGTFIVSLICILVLKYRSGFGDVIQTTISFSVLYWAIVLSGWFLADLLPQARGRNTNVKMPSVPNA